MEATAPRQVYAGTTLHPQCFILHDWLVVETTIYTVSRSLHRLRTCSSYTQRVRAIDCNDRLDRRLLPSHIGTSAPSTYSGISKMHTSSRDVREVQSKPTKAALDDIQTVFRYPITLLGLRLRPEYTYTRRAFESVRGNIQHGIKVKQISC